MGEVMFKTGDKVVYPAQGVGIVEKVEEMSVMGISAKFLTIRILENNAVIRVPVNKAEKVGMRRVIDDSSVDAILEILHQKAPAPDTKEKVSWTVRHREYGEKLKSGDIKEVAEVYRDLMQLRFVKDLSFGERRLLENAQQFLAGEISEAKGISIEEANETLRAIFEKEEEMEKGEGEE